MQSDSNLRETLRSIDHKSYPAYKSLRGSYRFADYVLSIDHVQGDPFAAPSHVRVTVDAKAAAFPEYAMKNTRTRTALADELLRTFAAQINHFTFKAKGSGKSGLISVTHCGQEILTRTACEVNEKEISMTLSDHGPGIENVELAMKEGYSTAPDNIRCLGFGAGMGLPNIKKYTDEFKLETEVGVGTTLCLKVYIQ